MKKGKPLPPLPNRQQQQQQRWSGATITTYASTPSRFYISDEGFDPTRAGSALEVVSPETETTPHLLSTNTITYHPNRLELLGEEGAVLGMPDPLDATAGSAVFDGLSPTQSFGQGHARQPPQIEHYDIVGGWTQDAFGRTVYVDHGTIEDVDEGDEVQRMDEDHVLLPRPSSLELSGRGGRRGFEWELTEPLPSHTTPPPRPRPMVRREIVHSPVTTQSPFRTPEIPGAVDENWDMRRRLPAKSHHSEVDTHTDARSTGSPLAALPPEMMDLEMQTIEDMLALVNNGRRDTKILRDHFIKFCAMFFLPDHIDATYRVEKALSDVEGAINRRKKIPQPHWDCRSAEWQQRYETRLISLRKSVQRLLAIRRFVDSHSHRPKETHLATILEKLYAHERKYIDIAEKLQASFDRLKLRHLHVMLVDAYAAEIEAQKTREDRRRESFYRRRAEAKVKREVLRKEFYAMRSSRGHSTI